MSKYAIFTVRGVQYSAPSQLIGQRLMVRLVHHSTILEMNVESYRRRAAQAAQPSARRARPTTTTPATA